MAAQTSTLKRRTRPAQVAGPRYSGLADAWPVTPTTAGLLPGPGGVGGGGGGGFGGGYLGGGGGGALTVGSIMELSRRTGERVERRLHGLRAAHGARLLTAAHTVAGGPLPAAAARHVAAEEVLETRSVMV
jgi:hypothetical protein